MHTQATRISIDEIVRVARRRLSISIDTALATALVSSPWPSSTLGADKVAASIKEFGWPEPIVKEFGWQQPIVVDVNWVIVVG